MEILSEKTIWAEYYSIIGLGIILAIVAMSLLITGINVMFQQKRVDFADVVVCLLLAGVVVFIAWNLINEINIGPTVEYLAIITDYNEVYAQGYEVVRTQGELTILTKGGR